MNAIRGSVVGSGPGTAKAAANYARAKTKVTVSVTNRGDSPVLVRMRNASGAAVASFSFAPNAAKRARQGTGVKSVEFQCEHAARCRFDYEVSAV